MRKFLEFSYDGTAYAGYQIQPNALSVQEVLEEKLSLLLGEQISITGAGRTDAGVHASKMFAHFDADEDIDPNLVSRLNSFLPADIAIHRLIPVMPHAHARFDATYRQYQYYIHQKKNPFLTRYSWYVRPPLDWDRMNAACERMLLHRDFESFAKVGSDNKTTLCQLYDARWEQNAAGQLVFTVRADRFLRNMVRAMVGTCVTVGMGKITPEAIDDILSAKNRGAAGTSAPAHALFLTDVGYTWENILL